MPLAYLKPISDTLAQELAVLPENRLGSRVDFLQANTDELGGYDIAILTVGEGRGSDKNCETGSGFDNIRKSFYELHPGNWNLKIIDLGHLPAGNDVNDTYFALKEICSDLVRKSVIPIVLGGSHDLTYACYRAFDKLEQTVNLTCVDQKLDLGNLSDPISANSFLSHVIMEEPSNLFNFSNIGYQTYYNGQDELDLIKALSFDAYRLGEAKDLKIIEPICRDSDIVSIDLSALRRSESPACANSGPNGFYADEICAISRYSGISDKLSIFGIFEYNPLLDPHLLTAQTVAQMVWYFLEGVNYRAKDFPFGTKESYFKYIVPHEDEEINFYKSDKSGRWWMEIKEVSHNKLSRHALVPCTYEDYLEACDQKFPDRWFRALKKFS